MLLAKKVDYVLMDELVVQYIFENHPNEARTKLSVGTTPLLKRALHLAVRRAHPEAASIVERFNAQLRGMIADRTYHRLLNVSWILADVDGDGVTELVPKNDLSGREPPKQAYRCSRPRAGHETRPVGAALLRGRHHLHGLGGRAEPLQIPAPEPAGLRQPDRQISRSGGECGSNSMPPDARRSPVRRRSGGRWPPRRAVRGRLDRRRTWRTSSAPSIGSGCWRSPGATGAAGRRASARRAPARGRRRACGARRARAGRRAGGAGGRTPLRLARRQRRGLPVAALSVAGAAPDVGRRSPDRPGDVAEAARLLGSRGYAPMSRGPSAIDSGSACQAASTGSICYDSFGQRQRTDVDYEEIWRGRTPGRTGSHAWRRTTRWPCTPSAWPTNSSSRR